MDIENVDIKIGSHVTAPYVVTFPLLKLFVIIWHFSHVPSNNHNTLNNKFSIKRIVTIKFTNCTPVCAYNMSLRGICTYISGVPT